MSSQLQSQQQASQLEGQAQTNSGQEVLAVACVIDASLALATEWTRVLTAYILPILKRLNEAYSGHSVRFTCFVLLSSSMLSMGDVVSSD
jgi:mediator of RNA polymerase II transcription subunit 25